MWSVDIGNVPIVIMVTYVEYMRFRTVGIGEVSTSRRGYSCCIELTLQMHSRERLGSAESAPRAADTGYCNESIPRLRSRTAGSVESAPRIDGTTTATSQHFGYVTREQDWWSQHLAPRVRLSQRVNISVTEQRNGIGIGGVSTSHR